LDLKNSHFLLTGVQCIQKIFLGEQELIYVSLLDKTRKSSFKFQNRARNPERICGFPARWFPQGVICSESYLGNLKWSMVMTFCKSKSNHCKGFDFTEKGI
jgi:hypothetical protein